MTEHLTRAEDYTVLLDWDGDYSDEVFPRGTPGVKVAFMGELVAIIPAGDYMPSVSTNPLSDEAAYGVLSFMGAVNCLSHDAFSPATRKFLAMHCGDEHSRYTHAEKIAEIAGLWESDHEHDQYCKHGHSCAYYEGDGAPTCTI